VAATVAAGPAPGRQGQQWGRKYPPLIALAVAILIALAVLPSSLNLPQSNPSTTLEYAPVPPDDKNPPPPANGNLSSLGLAGSSSLSQGGAPGGDEGGQPDNNALLQAPRSSSTKRCVGNPPRQTEDPLSPPCVADFKGDNFGSTYQGVTKEEIKVLFYVQGFTRYTNTCQDPNQVTPDREYFDLANGPEPGEHCYVRVLRNWQTYFNDRYATYGRFVHFYAYFSGQGESAEDRRADAADNYARLKPFAVMSVADGQTYADDYLQVMAQRGVLNFGAFSFREQAFFNKFPKLVWGYKPSLEEQAKTFVAYICTKIKGNPVDFSNNPQDMGKPRVYGFWHANDKNHPELAKLANVVKQGTQACGITYAADDVYPEAGYAKSAHYTSLPAQQAVADFAGKAVTTVIWPGGLETNFTNAADSASYRPEILALGDGVLETQTSGTFQSQNVWDKARVVSVQTAVFDETKQLCYRAYREAVPDGSDTEIRVNACPLYPQIRQLFTGIQVAGPRLTPSSIDKGFHAIPKVASTNPEVPACFYNVNDYTCVKDANVQHWDRTGSSSTSSSGQGCFRLPEGGKRYLADTWPPGNATAQDQPGSGDPCNAYDGGFLINPAPPDQNDLQ
jgi:hypothetical protein